jgi:hypothetical protein
MTFEGPAKRKKLLWSMGILAAIVTGAGFATVVVTGFFRSQNPIYQCVDNPAAQPFQLSIPISATENGAPAIVPKGVGISPGCIHPIHTLEENVIHVAYSRQYDFTLGHFLYYWIGTKLQNYDIKVYINGIQYRQGSILDIPLKQGQSIRIELTNKS